ncbi:hypothetical protein NST63_26605 [Heyndrickxia sp. FSL W8-0496]|uniref:hypothetical protein n=1 Tax=Heyndrickxia TaxID=2837504 RepID=UPI0030FA6981
MKFQRKVGLALGAILSILILAACSDKIEISNESLAKQLIGKTLTLNGNEIEITSDMLKSVKIEGQEVEKDSGNVKAVVQLEQIEKEKGSKNKQNRINHLKHIYIGDIIVPFHRGVKQWEIVDTLKVGKLEHETSEIENLLKIIPFEKSKEDILDDLSSSEQSISVKLENVIGYKSERKASFNSNQSGTLPITKINQLEIAEITEGNTEIEKKVSIDTDFDFEIDDPMNIYKSNGSYNAKGSFEIIYQIKEHGKMV